jgi:hypothetical protein
VDRLRSWQARRGECGHVFYIDQVERARSRAFGHLSNYQATVKCEICTFFRQSILQYNPLNELHRLVIELDGDQLTFTIDDSVLTCFRLGFVRLGNEVFDTLGRSLVTNVDEWMHISRRIFEEEHEGSLSLHANARGQGEVRVLRNGNQIVRMSFAPPVMAQTVFGGMKMQRVSLSRASYIPGPILTGDVLDIEIRYTGGETA